MTWVDAAVLFVIALSALFSVVRGFVREVLGVVAWVGAGAAAVKFYPLIVPEISSVLPMKNFVNDAAMGVVFIVVLVILSLLGALVGDVVRNSPLSGLDSSLGLIFGALRGVLVVCLGYIALSVGLKPADWPPPVIHARCLPLVQKGAAELVTLVPTQYRPALPDPNTLGGAPANGSISE
jgi:membrane protein required for colicin V production